jgi:hypothetical protein
MRPLSTVTVAMPFTVAMNPASWYRIDAGVDLMFW